MTIPSRPAPVPPGSSSRGQSAAAGANASIEQLRQQLQQQHQQQQQLGGIQKSTIKLPPPPKGPMNTTTTNLQRSTSNNNNYDFMNGSNSAITRKFPQARYTPATNWDDTPFSNTINASQNGNFKKVPPPRPPPPKVQVNGVRKTPARPQTSSTSTSGNTNILTSIFNRKKSAKASDNSASRVYGVSSGNYSSTTTTALSSKSCSQTATSTTATHHSTTNGLNNTNTDDWNACWNTTTTTTTTNYSAASFSSLLNTKQNASTEAQLISFDSPPSSPTFTQKSNSDCLSVDSFSSDSNFSSPNNGSVSQPESGFEDDFSAARSRPATTSPLDPWEAFNAFGNDSAATTTYSSTATIGTAPVRNLNSINSRISNDNPLCNGKSLLPPAPSLNMPTIIKPKISQKPKAPKPPLYITKHTNAGAVFNDNLTTPTSPPMPQCPPPPPPPTGFSLIDVISGKVDAIHLSAGASYSAEETSQPYGIALYDFDGVEEGDLNFRENEKIYLLEKLNEEWYRGRTRAGCEGIFPVNYVEVKVPLGNTTSTSSSAYSSATATSTGANSFTMQNSNTYATATTATSNTTPTGRCLYNFPAEVEGDLALRENDVVTILYRINEDWLYGEIDGRQGQFPSNFLENVPNNIPMP